jgi:uncharacterized membrane protein YfcA
LLTALLLGGVVGTILGLTGAGGGILAVPALTLGLGWTMNQAAPVALLSVAIASSIGALNGLKRGELRYRAAILMATVGILFAQFGQWAAKNLTENILIIIFTVIMFLVAFRLWRSAETHSLSDDGLADSPKRIRKITLHTGRIVWNFTSFITLSAIGALAGMTTGLLGVGGGFIIVPALLRCSEVTLTGIVATSLMVIALISGVTFILTLSTTSFEMPLLGWLFICASAVGMVLGRYLSVKIPQMQLQRFLAILIFIIALILIIR